jgi:MFS family permease
MWLLYLVTIFFSGMEVTYPVGWAVVGDLFGRAHFAKIRGYMSFFYMWGGVVGPIVAGAIYDRWQTYEPLLWTLIVLSVVSGLFYGVVIRPWEAARSER